MLLEICLGVWAKAPNETNQQRQIAIQFLAPKVQLELVLLCDWINTESAPNFDEALQAKLGSKKDEKGVRSAL